MTALPSTGVKLVDAELERRAPFPNAEAAEAAATRLLAIWHVLRPDSARSTESSNIEDDRNG